MEGLPATKLPKTRGKSDETGEDDRSRRREVQWRKGEVEEDKEEERLLKTGTVTVQVKRKKEEEDKYPNRTRA